MENLMRYNTNVAISKSELENEEYSNESMSDFSNDDPPFPDEKIDKNTEKIEREEKNLLLVVDVMSSWIYKIISVDLMWAYYVLKLNKEEETKKLFPDEKVFRCICASNMKKSSEFLSEYHVERSCKNTTYTIEAYIRHLFDAAFKNDFGFIMNNHHANSSWNLRCPTHACQFMFLSMLFSVTCEHKTLLNPWLELYTRSDDYCKIVSLRKIDQIVMSGKLKILIH